MADEELDDGLAPADTTLREDLESAIAAATDDAGAAIDDARAAPAQASQEPQEPQASGEGEQAPPDDAAEPDSTPAHLADAAYPDDTTRYPALTDTRVAKAPEGWRPAAREGFADLPESVRREIHRREIDINVGMQTTAEARRLSESFNSVVKPFEPLIAAEGAATPMEAVEGLLKTAAALKMGTPQQKAQRLAQLVQHYDIDIGALDEALTSQISGDPAQNAVSDPVQQAIDARMAPLEQFMQQLNGRAQEQQQTAQQALGAEIAAFEAAGHEFFPDVRMDMAELMDMAARAGRSLSLDDAYTNACRMNPQVAPLAAAREQQSSTAQRQSHVAGKVALAQTSHAPAARTNGSADPNAGIYAPDSTSLRQDIMNAIKVSTGE